MRLIGWLPSAGTALVLTVGLIAAFLFQKYEGDSHELWRVIEVIVPLAFSSQAAFLLVPENEQPLELLLACPQPLGKVLLQRLFVLVLLQASVAFLASLIALALPGGDRLGLALARWIAASVALGGAALFTAQMTRQGIFGALVALLLWAGSLYGGDALLVRWPQLWPWHLFLQPQDSAPMFYALNRVVLIIGGLGMIALAVFLLRNDERVLGVK